MDRMDKSRDEDEAVDPKSVDPNAPHAFIERMNVPYNIPKPTAFGQGSGPEFPFARASASEECELCGKALSDRIHAASEEAADNENWPV